MKRNLLNLLGLISVLMTAAAQPLAPALEVDQTVTRFCEALLGSFNGGDVNQFLTTLDTTVVVTWQNGEVCEGRTAIKPYVEKMTKGDHPIVSKIGFAPKVLGRNIQGDCALAWGELNDHFILTDGRDLPLNSHFTATMAKHDDGWKVTAFHASVDAFSNPITAMAIKKTALVAGIGGIITGVIVGLVIASLLKRSKNPA